MFNVTVLKMKDLIKYFLGITITLLVIITISKNVKKDADKEEKIVQNVKSGIQTLAENSMLQCLDQTIPTMSNINEEYRNIANEDYNEENQDVLQMILNTQISSIKGIEISEEKLQKETELAKIQENENPNNTENDENSSSETQEEQKQLARNRNANTSNYKQSNSGKL